MGFKLKGAKELEKALRDVAEKGAEAAVDGMRAEAAHVLDDAQAAAPIETGRLRASGRVVDTDDGAQVTFDTPYAVVVHERAGGRGFKFLERALLARAKQVAKEVAQTVERKLK